MTTSAPLFTITTTTNLNNMNQFNTVENWTDGAVTLETARDLLNNLGNTEGYVAGTAEIEDVWHTGQTVATATYENGSEEWDEEAGEWVFGTETTFFILCAARD